MSLKNEIFEGIAAYKALTPTAEDKYKGEMYKIAKRENDDWEERQRAKEEAIAAGRPTTAVPQQIQQNIPTMSRSDAIGPLPPTFPPTQVPTGTGQNMRRGGRVRRFAEGGFMGGLASGIKSTFQAPRALNVNQWTRPPRARDAGIPGSDDIAQDAARRYGSVEAPAAAPAQPSFPIIDYGSTGGTEGTGGVGGSATDGSGGSAAAGVGGDDGGTYRRGGRVKAFDDGGPVGLGSALRGGRPVYNPDEDPNVQERNRADAIIREIISAQVGEPNPANDPSIELRERGERDREERRSKSDTLPPYVPVPGTEPPRTAITPKPPAPDRAGPTPAAATRADLEAKYRSQIPEPPEPDTEPMNLNRDSDDAALSTGSATQPPGADTDDAYLSTGNARQDAEGNYRSQFPRPPQDQPISDAETQAIKLRTPLPPRSRYRDWAEQGIDEDAANARANQEDWRKRERERRQTRGKASAERQKAEPGLFENLTPEEMRARREREEAAAKVATSTEPPNIVYPQREEELRALETKVPPVEPTQPTQNLPTKRDGTPAAPAAPAAPAGPRPAGAGDPSVYGPVVSRPAADPDYTGTTATPPPRSGDPSVYGPVTQRSADDPDNMNVRAPRADQPRTADQPVVGPTRSVGNNTPGGRPGGQPTPPSGSATANRPSTAEKPDTRVAAFDPTVDRVDPSTGLTLPRQLDAQGRAIVTGPPPVAQGDGGPPGSPSTGTITRTSSTQTYGGVDTQPGSLGSATGYTNRDIAQTLNGAATLVRPGVNGGPPPIGHLAASPQAFNAYVQHHNQGGKFTPGEAMLVGMVSDYKMLLKQGRVAQANQMAYGLLQAANIEAASHGMVARDKAMAGDWQGAKQSLVNGLNYIGDGVSQRLSADGQHMESYDARTGAVTARTPLDGRTILAGIMGLANGDLFWKTLQASAQMLQKPDRGLTGRLLSDELKRRQIALADARLARGSAPRGGSGTSSGMSGFQRDLARIRGEKVSSGGGGGGGGGGAPDNSDLDIINWNTETPEPPPE